MSYFLLIGSTVRNPDEPGGKVLRMKPRDMTYCFFLTLVFHLPPKESN